MGAGERERLRCEAKREAEGGGEKAKAHFFQEQCRSQRSRTSCQVEGQLSFKKVHTSIVREPYFVGGGVGAGPSWWGVPFDRPARGVGAVHGRRRGGDAAKHRARPSP